MTTACTTQPFARWYVWEVGMNIMSDFPTEIVRIYDYSSTMVNPDYTYKYNINAGWTTGNIVAKVKTYFRVWKSHQLIRYKLFG